MEASQETNPIYDQNPACLHDIPIGSDCKTCGTTVGVDGPDQIAPGQVWRARGWPYGKIAIVSAENGKVEWFQAEGIQVGSETDFRDEFWYWGTPGTPTRGVIQHSFEEALSPIMEKMGSKELAVQVEAHNALAEQLKAFKATHGYAPGVTVVLRRDTKTGEENTIAAVQWPSEEILKKIAKP